MKFLKKTFLFIFQLGLAGLCFLCNTIMPDNLENVKCFLKIVLGVSGGRTPFGVDH